MDDLNSNGGKREHLFGICKECGGAIYSENDIAQNVPFIKCRACKSKELAEQRRKEREDEAKRIYRAEHAKANVLKTLIVPGIIITVLIIIAFFVDVKSGLYSILGGALLYMAAVQLLWGSEPVLSVLLFFMRAPKFTIGLIFELSIDGCIMFIIVKLALWALGILLSIVCVFLGIVITLMLAPFTFQFKLYGAIKHPEKVEFLFGD